MLNMRSWWVQEGEAWGEGEGVRTSHSQNKYTCNNEADLEECLAAKRGPDTEHVHGEEAETLAIHHEAREVG